MTLAVESYETDAGGDDLAFLQSVLPVLSTDMDAVDLGMCCAWLSRIVAQLLIEQHHGDVEDARCVVQEMARELVLCELEGATGEPTPT